LANRDLFNALLKFNLIDFVIPPTRHLECGHMDNDDGDHRDHRPHFWRDASFPSSWCRNNQVTVDHEKPIHPVGRESFRSTYLNSLAIERP
jgi:hypothetical protein